MKKILVLFLIGVLFSSCSEKNYYDVTVEWAEVSLNAQELVAKAEEGFRTRSEGVEQEYVHVFPTSYKAYFVSAENKGDYVTGQLITTITVLPGQNTINIPKLKYNIYISNYEKEGSWYTWEDAVNQLPVSSDILYLYGKNAIDYSSVTTGTVDVKNPYAAVMIKKNDIVTGIPTHYDNADSPYVLVTGNWYLKYIRLATTNTKVPVKYAYVQNYTLNEPITANKIYKFTLIGVGDTDGNLNVNVETFIETIEKEIPIL